MIKSKISNNSFVSEILASSQREHHHDVKIVCSNGAVKSNSFLMASMFPILRGILDTPVQLDDVAVIFLPDLDKIDLETFFDGLLSPALELKVCRDMAVLLMPVGAIIDSDLDIGLPDHVKDQEYLNTIKDRLPSPLDEVRPDAVLYDADVDPHIDDDLGKLDLTDDGLYARDEFVIDTCVSRGVPVSCVIGGGYHKNLDILSRRHSIVHRAASDVYRRRLML